MDKKLFTTVEVTFSKGVIDIVECIGFSTEGTANVVVDYDEDLKEDIVTLGFKSNKFQSKLLKKWLRSNYHDNEYGLMISEHYC